jgi:hypothetical protein
MKNECGKTRDKSNPYEVWQMPNGMITWLVLKKYQAPDKEATNPYARWFCLGIGPMTYGEYNVETGEVTGGYDLGDTYVNEIKSNAVRIK